jgi:hypothetical protein
MALIAWVSLKPAIAPGRKTLERQVAVIPEVLSSWFSVVIGGMINFQPDE